MCFRFVFNPNVNVLLNPQSGRFVVVVSFFTGIGVAMLNLR